MLSLLTAVVSRLNWGRAPPAFENPLAGSTFTQLTNFDGSELDAALSPDGRFVAFLSDHDGPFHVWLKQLSTGSLKNLTPGAHRPEKRRTAPAASGFQPTGLRSGSTARAAGAWRSMPLLGRRPRAPSFERKRSTWPGPRTATRLVYFTWEGDPLLVADSSGGNTREILAPKTNDHNHFPAWSVDGRWIYLRSWQPVRHRVRHLAHSVGGRKTRTGDRAADMTSAT